MLRLWIFVLMIGLVVLPVQAQDEDLPPYLYYYSDVLNAFVIERADGTDSRVLGAGLMPSETNHVVIDPGWSPSGDWFAWTSGAYIFDQRIYQHPWIVSANGSQRISLLDEIRDIDDIKWSPTEDLLFVSDIGNYKNEEWDEPFDVDFYLINVAENSVITRFTMNTTIQSYSDFTWIPNGSGVTFYYSKPSEGEQPAQNFFRIVSRDGTITDKPVGHIGYSFYFPNPAISKLGWFATLSSDSSHLVVENLIATRYLEFDAPSKDISDIQWSPGGKAALIFADNDLWLLTPSENTLEKIAENVQMGATDVWVFIPWSYTLDVAVIDKEKGELELLQPDAEPMIIPIELPSPFENPQTKWFPEGNRLFISGFHNDDYVNYIYDLETADLEQQDNIQQGPFYSSSDQRYRIIDGPIIIDETTGEQTPIRPHSSMIEDNGIDSDFLYANWHPNAYWAITADVPVDYMDTSYDPQTIGVTNQDGSIRRELGTCFYYCADWLPEFIDVQKLPIGKPNSVVPVPTEFYDIGQGDIHWLSWSPDGKRLAVMVWDETLLLQVRDIEDFSLITQEVIDENISRAIWVESENGSYTMHPTETGGESVILGMRGGISDPPISSSGDLYLNWSRVNNDFEIGLYSTTSDERVVKLENPRGGSFSGLTKYTPDDKYVFYWSRRDRVHIWNTQTGDLVGLLNIYTPYLALSSDSQQIATGQFNYIQIWNIEDVVN